MFLKPEERLFFIHIPKTAGTTLIPVIDQHFHETEICPAQLWREFVTLPQESLPDYRLFRGHFGAGGLNSFLPEPPVLMTMLRDPVALAASTYKFILREPGTRVHQLVRRHNMSLEDFLDHPRTRGKVSNKQTRHLSFDLEHDPDSGPIFLNRESREAVDRWVREHKTRIRPDERLDRAKRKILECRFFGLVERFEESMLLLSYTFGWAPIGRVQKLRVAPSSGREEMSDSARERILELNRFDGELYAFACDEFERRLSAMHEALDSAAALDPDETESAHPPGREDDFVSPEHARTYRKLDRWYQDQRMTRGEPKRETIRLSLAEAMEGDGWHRREASAIDGSTFRWTGPGEVSTIDLPLKQSNDLRVTLCVINVLDERIIDEMAVFVNGHPIEMTGIPSDVPGRVFQGEVPQEVVESNAAFTRLSITVPFTVRPCDCESHSDDTRSVGLAVNWIDLSPISDVREGEVPEEVVTLDELERRKEQRRAVIAQRVKHRVAQIPVIGPKLRNAYVRLKSR